MQKPLKCVLVEDDPDIAFMVKMALQTHGIELRAVSSEFHTICNKALWKDVDVGIIDILLGQSFTGIDVLRWMKSWVPEVKRISYSAVVDTELEFPGLADGSALKGDLRDLFSTIERVTKDESQEQEELLD